MEEIFLTNRNFEDLNPIIFGRESCAPQKAFGPAIRKYTLIHYVEQGKGKLIKSGKEYEVHSGEAFIILPDEVSYYEADNDSPWTYRWIGFDGKLSEKYKHLPTVVSISDDMFPNAFGRRGEFALTEYLLAGQLFTMTAELLLGIKHRNHHVRQVKNYINSYYMREISVEEIAEHLCLDRRYLSRLFKEKTGKTIQEYLISVRMEEAKHHLAAGRSVNETASLCGYNDVCNFSKMFKKIYGISPANWKNSSEVNFNI